MSTSGRIVDLLLRWEEQRRQGQEPTPEELCPGEPVLQDALRRHIDERERFRRFWSQGETTQIQPPPPAPSQSQPTLSLNESLPVVPGYEILGVLGRGGMGVVYKARQVEAGRVVAIKMISGGYVEGEPLQRFHTEVESIARLTHPNIVQVYEVGQHRGLPFFSLEFCPGGSLDQRLKQKPMPPAEGAKLVEVLARALDFAHRKGIIHRDIKPANVLLAEDGTPKVTDFGLARKLEMPGNTLSGQIIGTASYMAPEQARGEPHQMDARTDVYQLGAVLYEILTGKPPFRGSTVLQTIEMVLYSPPVAPRVLNPTLPRDLETIALKCLQKDPRRRYPSAAALADDLRRFLAGMPIHARPVGAVERTALWCRRRPAVASLLTAAALSLLAAIAGLGLAWRQSERARAVTERAYRTEAEQRRAVERQLYFSRIALAARELQAGKSAWARNQLSLCPEEHRHWEWWHLDACLRGQGVTSLLEHRRGVSCLAAEPSGRLLASASGDGTVRLWDLAAGKAVRVLAGHEGSVSWVCFSADGRQLASAGDDGQVILWDAGSGRILRRLEGHEAAVSVAVFHPRAPQLASGTFPLEGPGLVRVWDLEKGEPRLFDTRHQSRITALDYSPDGAWLASATHDATVRLTPLSGAAPALVFRGHAMPVSAAAFSPDGRTLASAAGRLEAEGPEQGEVLLWDAKTGEVVHRLHGHTRRPTTVAFSPDGQRLATAGWDGEIKVWDVASGQEVLTLTAGQDAVMHLTFSGDGVRLASGGLDGVVRVWTGGKR